MYDRCLRRRSILGLLVAAIWSLAGAAGCLDSVQGYEVDPADWDDDLADEDPATDDVDETAEPGDEAPPVGPGAGLVGTWGQLLNLTVIQSGVPLLGSSWAASRNWYLVEVTTDGQGNLTATEQLCAVKLKLDTWVDQSIVPEGFVEAAEILERQVAVESDEPGTPWVSGQVIEVRGADLCNGQCDPELSLSCDRLPASGSAEGPEDAPPCDGECGGSHCDQDEDGRPGMTTILSGMYNCELYVAQRWGAAFDGEIIDEDTIGGAVSDHFSEQSVLASSSPFCSVGDPVSAPEDCPEHQYFKMVRLPHGATCTDVLQLTDCDEDEASCDTNAIQPLDPKNDLPGDCS